MFYINKWHKGQSGKGYVVELSQRDEQTGEWTNTKVYIPDAAQYAGKDKSEYPAALAGVNKDGVLVIKCYRKDNFSPTPYKDKANKKALQQQLPDPERNAKIDQKLAEIAGNEDIPF